MIKTFKKVKKEISLFVKETQNSYGMKSDESVVTIDLVTLVARFIKIRSQFIRKRVSALQKIIDAELTFYKLF